MPFPLFSRRRAIRSLAGVAAAPALLAAQDNAPAFPGKRSLLIHNDYPEDLETPVELFDTWITPIDSFFVRQHLPRPKVDPAAYRLNIDGLAAKPFSLSLSELQALPRHTVTATLECAGNGRRNFRPRMPGLQWSKGAIGNATWRGPRLGDVLRRAGLDPAAAFIDVDGADVGVATTPDFIRSIPVRKALHESTLLALEMNGQPLPGIHGGPVRLIVPGWDGASWVKWVTRVTASKQTHPGFYVATAYRYPRNPTPPGVAPKPEEMEIIEGMAVKSFFTRPAENSKLPLAKAATIHGIAWAGEHRIVRTEWSADGGATWQPAILGKEDQPFAWRLFSFDWKPARPGYHLLMCRATDSAGRTQPVEPYWNPSGYLWNAIDRLPVIVEA